MTIILIWIVFCIVVAVIANARGRSGAGFFFLSLTLSPLAGIILAAALPDRSEERQATIDDYDTRKCPYCAERIKRAATVCRFCQRETPAAEPVTFKPGPTIHPAIPIGIMTAILCGYMAWHLLGQRSEMAGGTHAPSLAPPPMAAVPAVPALAAPAFVAPADPSVLKPAKKTPARAPLSILPK